MLFALASCSQQTLFELSFLAFLTLHLSSKYVENIPIQFDLSLSHFAWLTFDSRHLSCSEHLGRFSKMYLFLKDKLLEVLSDIINL